MDDILQIIRDTGALETTRASASAEARRAINAAQKLPSNQYRSALLQLAADLLERRS